MDYASYNLISKQLTHRFNKYTSLSILEYDIFAFVNVITSINVGFSSNSARLNNLLVFFNDSCLQQLHDANSSSNYCIKVKAKHYTCAYEG